MLLFTLLNLAQLSSLSLPYPTITGFLPQSLTSQILKNPSEPEVISIYDSKGEK